MTPEELNHVVNAVLSQQNTIPTWAYLGSALIFIIGLGIGAFTKRVLENSADNFNMKNQLSRIERTIDAQKSIEERIAHSFLEEREVTRIKRAKIEEITEHLEKEVRDLQTNITDAIHDGILFTSETSLKVLTLTSLYFYPELETVQKKYTDTVIDLKNYLLSVVSDELPTAETTLDESGQCKASFVSHSLLTKVHEAEREFRKEMIGLMQQLNQVEKRKKEPDTDVSFS